MRIADLDYCLPTAAIAQTPIEPRDASRMLHLNPANGEISHGTTRGLTELLHTGDLVILNNTRVTARRVYGKKKSGGLVEALLLKRDESGLFHAMVRPAKRLKNGMRFECEGGLEFEVVGELAAGIKLLNPTTPADEWESIGEIPLPPYIHQPIADESRYQTVYNAVEGSAAAPTAGLHFTRRLIEDLKNRGIQFATISLDVSLDTFRPMQTTLASEHAMHGERYFVPEETASLVSKCKGRIIAVGTTTARTLEAAAIGKRSIRPGGGETKLFITPGYTFKVVDGLLTNFHMPRTTMLMMVAALCGLDKMKAAYEQALDLGYRFLSFGDSMLILEEKK